MFLNCASRVSEDFIEIAVVLQEFVSPQLTNSLTQTLKEFWKALSCP